MTIYVHAISGDVKSRTRNLSNLIVHSAAFANVSNRPVLSLALIDAEGNRYRARINGVRAKRAAKHARDIVGATVDHLVISKNDTYQSYSQLIIEDLREALTMLDTNTTESERIEASGLIATHRRNATCLEFIKLNLVNGRSVNFEENLSNSELVDHSNTKLGTDKRESQNAASQMMRFIL